MFAWLWDRRGWIAVVVPYVAVCASVVVALGVLSAKSDAAEVKAGQAVIAAELAEEKARSIAHDNAELQREQAQSCADRRQARDDLVEVLRLISTGLPARIAAQMAVQVAALKPIEC